MIAIIGTLGIFMIVILFGKQNKKTTIQTYFVIALLSIVQVVIVLYVLYTMQIPNPPAN